MSRISHLLSMARSLPATPFRPPGSPQLSDALSAIVTRSFPAAPSIASSSSSSAIPSSPSPAAELAANSGGGSDQPPASRDLGPSEERALEGMISALERIQSNQSLRDFPLGPTTSRPAHDPMYFKRMVNGVHLAQKGQGRSWWRRFFQVKGEA